MTQEPIRKRVPWDAVPAIRALEHEVYGIDPDLSNEVERSMARLAAMKRFTDRKALVAQGLRKEAADLQRVEQVGPLIALLRALEAERGNPRERLVRVAALIVKTRPKIAEVTAGIHEAMGPLGERGVLAANLGQEDELMWEGPRRVHAALDQLLVELDSFATGVSGYIPVTERLEQAKAKIVLALRSDGYSHSRIARLVDPEGYEEDRSLATDRVRKHLERLRKPGHEEPMMDEPSQP